MFFVITETARRAVRQAVAELYGAVGSGGFLDGIDGYPFGGQLAGRPAVARLFVQYDLLFEQYLPRFGIVTRLVAVYLVGFHTLAVHLHFRPSENHFRAFRQLPGRLGIQLLPQQAFAVETPSGNARHRILRLFRIQRHFFHRYLADAVEPGGKPAQHCGQHQREQQTVSPLLHHFTYSSKAGAKVPCACIIKSHSSRTAPQPAWFRVMWAAYCLTNQ